MESQDLGGQGCSVVRSLQGYHWCGDIDPRKQTPALLLKDRPSKRVGRGLRLGGCPLATSSRSKPSLGASSPNLDPRDHQRGSSIELANTFIHPREDSH